MADAVTAETGAYERDGYVALAGLFPVEVLHAFYNRMQADLQAGGRSMSQFAARGPLLKRDAIEVYAHVYPPMLTLLWGLTPRMALVMGRTLLPTYAYFRLYRQGDICRVHADRLACEHSLSLTIAYAENKPWALSVGAERLARPGPPTAEDFGDEAYGSVPMRAGDGVAYRARAIAMVASTPIRTAGPRTLSCTGSIATALTRRRRSIGRRWSATGCGGASHADG